MSYLVKVAAGLAIVISMGAAAVALTQENTPPGVTSAQVIVAERGDGTTPSGCTTCILEVTLDSGETASEDIASEHSSFIGPNVRGWRDLDGDGTEEVFVDQLRGAHGLTRIIYRVVDGELTELARFEVEGGWYDAAAIRCEDRDGDTALELVHRRAQHEGDHWLLSETIYDVSEDGRLVASDSHKIEHPSVTGGPEDYTQDPEIPDWTSGDCELSGKSPTGRNTAESSTT